MSDNFEPLVEAARGGDEQAFRALVEPLLTAESFRRDLTVDADRVRRLAAVRPPSRSGALGA